MDLQQILSNGIRAIRQENLKKSSQLTLGEIILKLEMIKNKDLLIVFEDKKHYPIDIGSWRGSYDELAIGYNDTEGKELSTKKFLKILKGAVGKTFEGYKGGDFLMGRNTPIWIALDGCCSGFTDKEIGIIDIKEEKKVIIKIKEFDY